MRDVYFLYRLRPLRLLYMGGKGWRTPPRNNSEAAMSVWYFLKPTAILLLRDANRRTPHDPISYAKRSQLRSILAGGTPALDEAHLSRAMRSLRDARELS